MNFHVKTGRIINSCFVGQSLKHNLRTDFVLVATSSVDHYWQYRGRNLVTNCFMNIALWLLIMVVYHYHILQPVLTTYYSQFV